MTRFSIFFAALVFAILQITPSFAASVVPPGNRNATQPKIPGGSIKRTKARKTTFDKKYLKIRNLLARDKKLRGKINSAAKAFGIDPIHIAGALVGEHTYNVDAYDRLQNYYTKALSYLGQSLSFEYDGVSVVELINQPAFKKCGSLRSDYDKWTCRESVWNTAYRGKTVAGKRWPNSRFGRVFFQPLYAGQTFGLGQLNPLTALKVNDLVRSKFPREPRLRATRAPEVYNTIMEPDSTLIYMAAVLRHSIDVYRSTAGYDISQNPGVTATLYNLGNVTIRARQLAAKNKRRKAQGKAALLPQENYYGWLINDKLSDLRTLF
ncbi:DUF1402 family protein [Pseudahrensia aquimaris]|uniref:DUF1402 family protein n=1 Tax=Pseudahrensia aquimaris TaxID=744461 RepID=A0ABW3FES4_9HYPH